MNNPLDHSKLACKRLTQFTTLVLDWKVVVVSKDSIVDNAKHLME
ncbi:hypothetical protein ACQVUZ_21355 [Bacillus cereus]